MAGSQTSVFLASLIFLMEGWTANPFHVGGQVLWKMELNEISLCIWKKRNEQSHIFEGTTMADYALGAKDPEGVNAQDFKDMISQ